MREQIRVQLVNFNKRTIKRYDTTREYPGRPAEPVAGHMVLLMFVVQVLQDSGDRINRVRPCRTAEHGIEFRKPHEN
jgi:hypothetical protein